MSYNFDTIIDRRGTHSLKYDFAVERGKPSDILPLWVADMDFQAPAEVLEELHKAVSHGIFGYSEMKKEYFDAVHDWFIKHFGWETKESWLVKSPGVVFAVATAVKAFSREGEAVMIQPPVYYPFYEAIHLNNRKLVTNTLVYDDHGYSIDFEDFEQKIITQKVKLFILCSPHNPVGRVWTREELTRMGEICLKHKVIVLSDEIHCDFTFPGYEHTVFAGISDEFAENSVICTAPSKTFNLAGLQVANLFIKNETLRQRFKNEVSASGFSQLNVLGLVACKAAYQYGEPWLQELRAYLYGNLQYVREFIKNNLPGITLVEPQGTYLIWLDCTALRLGRKGMEKLIVHQAKLWLDAGHIFGSCGEGFERINIACTRATLKQALDQLKKALGAI